MSFEIEGNVQTDAKNTKALVDSLGLQLEALMDAANYAIRMTYLLYAEGAYLSEHGAWVDLSLKAGENEDVYRNRVYARLRMERNTVNSIRAAVANYTDTFAVRELCQPSGSFILGASKLGSSARLFNYEQTVKGILIEVPSDMPMREIRAMFEDIHSVKEAAARVMIYQEGKGVVMSTANIAAVATLPIPTTETGGVIPDAQVNDPNKEYALFPNVVDYYGQIVGSALNKANTIFGVSVEVGEIIPSN